MQEQNQASLEQRVFGHYSVAKKMPFKIVQAPFRKFSKYQRDGHWNEKERLKYTVFIGFFRKLLEDPELKKQARVYEMMSDMIITRNASQCRSHHQKMEKYRANIDEIMASVTHKYEPSVYAHIQEKYTLFIKTLLENADKYVRAPTKEQNKQKQKNQGEQSSKKRTSRTRRQQSLSREVQNKRTSQVSINNRDFEEMEQAEVEGMEARFVKEEEKREEREHLLEQQAQEEEDDLDLDKKKEANKKTQEDYDDQSSKKSEQQQQGSLKEEAEEQRAPRSSSSFRPIPPSNPSLFALGVEPINSIPYTEMREESLLSLNENVRRWRSEREGWITKANQLFVQWNICQGYINMCDQNISLYEDAISRQHHE